MDGSNVHSLSGRPGRAPGTAKAQVTLHKFICSSSQCPHGFVSFFIQNIEVRFSVFLLVSNDSPAISYYTLRAGTRRSPALVRAWSAGSRVGHSWLGCPILSSQTSSYLDFLVLLFVSAHWTSPIAGRLPGWDYGNLVEGHTGWAAGHQSLIGCLISSLALRSPPAQLFISLLGQAQI